MQIDEERARTLPAHTSRGTRLSRRLAVLVLASDPGLSRLRMAASAAICVAVALAVEFGLALVTGATGMSVIVFMLFGGLLGMIGSNALAGHKVWANVRTAAFFPVALGVGLLAGIAVSWSLPVTLAVFVVVMFVAVYIRRFGPDFFFYGLLIWMGFFLSAFIHATIAEFLPMMLAIVVATALVLLLCVTVFRPNPRRTLARIFRSMDARSRNLAHACVLLLEADPSGNDAVSAQRRIVRARAQVRDAALMSDGWAAHAPALPPGWSAPALRRRLLDTQLSLDRLVAASRALSGASAEHRTEFATALGSYATGDDQAALTACAHLQTHSEQSPGTEDHTVRHATRSIAELIAQHPNPDSPPQDGDEYEPATLLPFGQLPGSPSVAIDVAARGTRWNPLARLRFTTRQAIQVAFAGALAIVAGSAISEQRYYWAVIATFVAFTGTGTRTDTARKAINRVLGTLVGLFAGVLLANLTSGHTLWALVVIVASIFCGFYLVRVSYAYMIFFITIMVSQLYSILGEFSDELLALRLGETAIGAAIGIVVALVVTPVSTRDTIAYSERELLSGIADVVDAAGDRLEDSSRVSPERLDRMMLGVDNSLRRLELVTEPLTRYYLWERRPRNIRRKSAVLTACVATTRELATCSRIRSESCPGAVPVYRGLTEEIRARTEPGNRAVEASGERLPELLDTTEITALGTHVDIPCAYEVGRLHDLLDELDDDD